MSYQVWTTHPCPDAGRITGLLKASSLAHAYQGRMAFMARQTSRRLPILRTSTLIPPTANFGIQEFVRTFRRMREVFRQLRLISWIYDQQRKVQWLLSGAVAGKSGSFERLQRNNVSFRLRSPEGALIYDNSDQRREVGAIVTEDFHLRGDLCRNRSGPACGRHFDRAFGPRGCDRADEIPPVSHPGVSVVS